MTDQTTQVEQTEQPRETVTTVVIGFRHDAGVGTEDVMSQFNLWLRFGLAFTQDLSEVVQDASTAAKLRLIGASSIDCVAVDAAYRSDLPKETAGWFQAVSQLLAVCNQMAAQGRLSATLQFWRSHLLAAVHMWRRLTAVPFDGTELAALPVEQREQLQAMFDALLTSQSEPGGEPFSQEQLDKIYQLWQTRLAGA